jgi:two-component system NtrC family sensor kinase
MSLAPVNSAIRSTTLMCSKFGLFFLIGGTIVILIITRNVLRPIKALTDGARKISKGNLEQHVKVRSKDEIGELAIAFNQMSENLSTSSRTIMELNRNLERKVLERTHELESSNQELKNAYAELRSAQNQVVRSEKLASIGRLVAGVAHELNNPINFIYGNMYHLKDYVSILQQAIKTYSEVNLDQKDREKISRMREELELNYLMEDLGKLIKSVEQGAERSRVIVRDLRSFSRLDETEVREIDIHESIETTLNLLTNRYKNRIIVHRDYGEIPKMFCYADIEQVFMNLLVNAGQAIEDKGNVWISTRLQGNKVVISIRDDGVGIEREYLDKIFDPFFTTKPVGEGTGLGLSITHEIIEKHNGEISVESELGKGTTFTVKLPI